MSRFLILDGYPESDREKFKDVGMTLAGELYHQMLSRHVKTSEGEIIFTSDSTELLDKEFISKFSGILWPGCSLTVYNDDWRVKKMLEIARTGFELGLPQFGSCWAAQVAVHLVGGKVSPHPLGREIGIARRIKRSEVGTKHPMHLGKPDVFEAFSSHDDFIEMIPKEFSPALTKNDWCEVQSVVIKYLNGEFWATQYHPEYNFKEMAKLLLARTEKLIKQNYFHDENEVRQLHDDFVLMHDGPNKHLLWKYGVGEGLQDEKLREKEFSNWLEKFFPNLLK